MSRHSEADVMLSGIGLALVAAVKGTCLLVAIRDERSSADKSRRIQDNHHASREDVS